MPAFHHLSEAIMDPMHQSPVKAPDRVGVEPPLFARRPGLGAETPPHEVLRAV